MFRNIKGTFDINLLNVNFLNYLFISLTSSQVLSALELIDQLKNQQHEYSFETVLYSEFEVFKMIHYQIQFITPLDYIEILLSLLNFQNLSELRSITIDILDLTFLQVISLLIY